MTILVQNITLLLSLCTIAALVCIVLFVLGALFFRKSKDFQFLVRFIAKNSVTLGFAISLAAFLSSIFYSTIAGFAPCELCWWQRIFLFPQVIIFSLGLYHIRMKKVEVHVISAYGLALSLIGACIAGYMYIVGTFAPSSLSCAAAVVSCAKVYFVAFGFVTIPLMSLTAFLSLICVAVSRFIVLPE